jgi:hypothetical protein
VSPRLGAARCFGRAMPLAPLVPSSWFRSTSTACSVPGLQRVAAGTRSGVRQVGPTSIVATRRPRGRRPARIVRGMPLCAMPFEGLLLVDSRSASLRSAPLVSFIASFGCSRLRSRLRSART